MQMMPKTSWPHRVASDAVARSTGALDATAMIFLPSVFGFPVLLNGGRSLLTRRGQPMRSASEYCA
jgi:hypothetical protein